MQESDEADEIIVKRPNKPELIDSNVQSEEGSEEENVSHFMTDVSFHTKLLWSESFNKQNAQEPSSPNPLRPSWGSRTLSGLVLQVGPA